MGFNICGSMSAFFVKKIKSHSNDLFYLRHICEQAYGQDYMAPSYNYTGIPSYLCGHNLLKAHAKVYHTYKNKFKDQNGEMQKGISGGGSRVKSRHELNFLKI